MIQPLITLIFAFLALGFLIFIHELGHYIVARRMGMEVETFGIGFGKALFSWKRKGVVWRFNWLPFGGYVKIKGMEMSGPEDPYTIKNGFFTKSPLKRIMVAAAGPFVNISFALLVFTLIWASGGRTKSFLEYTNKIGWVDPQSELYAKGVRPGDEILEYNGRPFQEAMDHIKGPMTAGDELVVTGNKIDYLTGQKESFAYTIEPYVHPDQVTGEIQTSGILSPAGYILYHPEKYEKVKENLKIDPREPGGIEEGDRIVWVDGERIFSQREMAEVLNDGRVLLTVERNGKRTLARVPRIKVGDLRLNPEMKDEISDWQHEAELVSHKLQNLFVIPYDMTPDGTIEGQLHFIDGEEEEEAFPKVAFSERSKPLQPGDKIVAVNGIPTNEAHQIFYQLQKKKIHAIVLRDSSQEKVLQPQEEEHLFETSVDGEALASLEESIGSNNGEKQVGNLVLLDPIYPVRQIDMYKSEKEKAEYKTRLLEQKKQIEQIENPQVRERSLAELKNSQQRLILGLIGVEDKQVISNPNPFAMSVQVVEEMWHVLKSLFTGSLSPKWVTGPIGMVQVVQKSWEVSMKDTLYWLGLISMNLGFLNLLPIPVLDGGYILLFFFEWLTGKKIKPKALERLIIPFVIIMILFFLFVTFNDLSRLFGGM